MIGLDSVFPLAEMVLIEKRGKQLCRPFPLIKAFVLPSTVRTSNAEAHADIVCQGSPCIHTDT